MPLISAKVCARYSLLAMMLNELPCFSRRIVFSSFEKFDGKEMRPLTPAEVKQIAGRAGRYGSKYHDGVVTCLHAVSSRPVADFYETMSPCLTKVLNKDSILHCSTCLYSKLFKRNCHKMSVSMWSLFDL